ncbi:hypothetical protein MNBD_ALPHA07-433, partial [hydrothermal vent metagenome]
MKNVIWIIVAAVVALGAYLVLTTKSVEDVSGVSVEAKESLEGAVDAVGEAKSEAVEEAVEGA